MSLPIEQPSRFRALEEARASCRRDPSLTNTTRLWELRHSLADEIRRGILAPGPLPAPPPYTGQRHRLAGLPVAQAPVAPETLRLALEQHSCVLVKRLATPAQARRLLDIAVKTYDAYDRFDRAVAAGDTPETSEYYQIPAALTPRAVNDRRYHRQYGGIVVHDAPLAGFELCEFYSDHAILAAIAACLGARPVISDVKTVVRKGDPASTVRHVFHQDGLFLHHRSINIWLSLTGAGIDAPGLELLPHNIGTFERAGGPGSVLPYEVLCRSVYDKYGEDAFWRPAFEPGDAMIFNERCLHRTHVTSAMSRDRYALETWFFAPDDAYEDTDLYYV